MVVVKKEGFNMWKIYIVIIALSFCLVSCTQKKEDLRLIKVGKQRIEINCDNLNCIDVIILGSYDITNQQFVLWSTNATIMITGDSTVTDELVVLEISLENAKALLNKLNSYGYKADMAYNETMMNYYLNEK